VAPRAYWKGYLKLSLVSCPVALFPASSEREKIRFHQINKATGNRIKYRKVDAETDEDVDTSDIVKGYEVGKGEYIELEPEELEAVAVESTRTLEIDEFVPKKEIDELYLCGSPRGSRRTLAGRRRRRARRKAWLRSRESSSHRASTSSHSSRAAKGCSALRCATRTKSARKTNIQIENEKIPKDMLELAAHIVETKSGHFNPQKFEDHYEEALKELLKKKQAGEKIEAPKEREPAKVISLMDALRRSVGAERATGGRRKPAPSSAQRRTAKRASRSSARHKKAG